MLVSCSYDNSIRFYAHDSDGDWIVTFVLENAHLNTVWAVAFNQTGCRLASVGADAMLKVCILQNVISYYRFGNCIVTRISND